MTFFTADTHFFHANIISFCKRPWTKIERMHEDMVTKWNETVTKDDMVYIVGDFLWPRAKTMEVADLLASLNGHLHLIPGDHDWDRRRLEGCGRSISIHEQVYTLCVDGVDPIVLAHWPFRNWPKSHYNSIHLFGHVHNNARPDPFYAYGRSFNVGVDVWDYKPVSLTQILEKVKTLGDNPNYIKR